jgi:hypothetical protein
VRVAALVGAVLALPPAVASRGPVPAATPPASAPPVYRCGNGYSNTPCPGATALPVDDPRTEDERRQREALTTREQRLAAVLEAERHRRELPPPAPPSPRPAACARPGAVATVGRRASDAGRTVTACQSPTRRRSGKAAPLPATKASAEWTARVPVAR